MRKTKELSGGNLTDYAGKRALAGSISTGRYCLPPFFFLLSVKRCGKLFWHFAAFPALAYPAAAGFQAVVPAFSMIAPPGRKRYFVLPQQRSWCAHNSMERPFPSETVFQACFVPVFLKSLSPLRSCFQFSNDRKPFRENSAILSSSIELWFLSPSFRPLPLS